MSLSYLINPFMTNGLVHQLGESTVISRVLGIFKFYCILHAILLSRQDSPRWGAADSERGVTSGAILFAYVP